jgi:hypothetical protein
MEVIKKLEYLEKKAPRKLSPINAITEIKKVERPPLRIFARRTIKSENTKTGKKEDKYDSIILTKPRKLADETLNASPVRVEIIITMRRLKSINSPMLKTLAEKTPNLDIGLVRVSFMVLELNSPLNISIVTNAVKRGSMVYTKKESTAIGNWRLPKTLNPRVEFIDVTAICPIIIAIIERIAAASIFFFFKSLSISLRIAALNPSISVHLANKIVFK